MKKGICCIYIGCLFEIICYLIYRRIYIFEGNYTKLHSSIYTVANNLRHYLIYNFDIFLLGILGFVICLIYCKKGDAKNFILLCINVTGWGYISGLLLWKGSQSYYLYPAAVMFILTLIPCMQIEWKKVVKKAFLGAFILFGCFMAILNYDAFLATVDVYSMYSEGLTYIRNHVSDKDRVFFETFFEDSEPSWQMNLLFELWEKNFEMIFNNSESDDCYAPKKGDYIVVFSNQRNLLLRPIRKISPERAYNGGHSAYVSEKNCKLECLKHNDYVRESLLSYQNGIAQYTIYYVENVLED